MAQSPAPTFACESRREQPSTEPNLAAIIRMNAHLSSGAPRNPFTSANRAASIEVEPHFAKLRRILSEALDLLDEDDFLDMEVPGTQGADQEAHKAPSHTQ